MEKITLGRSGLVVPRNGFGALPIQRISEADAVRLVRRALDGGMFYFDTARFYTDSEEKPPHQSLATQDRLCGPLSVPQSGLLPQARRWLGPL